MAIETERKFLVKGEFRHLSTKTTKITQSYLSIDTNKTIRVRLSDNSAYLGVKSRTSDHSISRNEWEYKIPLEDATEMMNYCLPGKIVKTRYLVPHGKHNIEVDVFHEKNDGLIIAEIEFSSEKEAFEKPEWLGTEVTGMAEYFNCNLIK